MSKRSRDGDVIAQRPPISPPYISPVAFQAPQIVGTKRSACFDCGHDAKKSRFHLDDPGDIIQASRMESQKRSADFDIELDRLHKRMRASTPSAEEVIAYMIPHLVRLREMYLSEQSKVADLTTKNAVLQKNNTAVTRALRDQLGKNHLIARQLENAHYRLVLASPSMCNVSLQ